MHQPVSLWIPFGIATILLVVSSLDAQTQSTDLGGNAERGKALYARYYCWSCHGYAGAGSERTGPRLAQIQLTKEDFIAFIRNPNRMPPYRAAVLPDSEAVDILAYIKTFPPPPSPEAIPLLSPD